jgi:hypothetical protein
MPVVQSTFTEGFVAGYPGMVATGETANRLTRTLEDASGLGFGKAAYRGVGDHGCIKTPAVGTLLGFTIADHGLVVTSTRPADTYAQNDNVGIQNRGTIWVDGSIAVADGDQVYVTPAGLITNSAAGNTIAPEWFFQETLAAAGLVRIARR